ncbi:MAG: hypothetical protein KDA92_18830, partial [Planctomycetales bacterium]|nr:hypothetical protein [Planctomycetales bacterium]
LQLLITKTYALASLVWRISFYIGVVLTSATLFHGAGIVISLMIGTLWILVPAIAFCRYMIFGQGAEQPKRWRFALLAGGALALVPASFLLPWPGGVVAVGVVDYEPLSVIRAAAPGFVTSITTRPGVDVVAGEPLATLENPQLRSDLSQLARDINLSQLRRQSLQAVFHRNASGSEQMYDEELLQDTLEQKQADLADKVASLEVVAPVNGRVIGRDFDSLYQRFLHEGDLLMSIGREDRKAIVVTVAQRDADFFLQQIGKSPNVRIKGRPTKICGAVLKEMNPRATKQLSHASLAAPNGGPLAVEFVANHDESARESFELLEPHFEAIVTLPAGVANQVRAGELAKVRLAAAGESIGGHLWKRFELWVGRKLKSST